MIRIELVREIARKCRLSRAQAAQVLEIILGCITTSMRDGRRLDVRGLGTFSLRCYGGYRGRNPKTGEPVEVAPKRSPYFKASSTLLRKMNTRPPRKPAAATMGRDGERASATEM
jgi:integration host factor subunit beta